MHTAALPSSGSASEWSYEAIEVAPEGFEARSAALPRRRVRRRQRHRPAQARRAGDRRPSLRRRRARSAPPTRSASPPAGSRPRTPTPPGCSAALPADPPGCRRSCSAPAARRAPASGPSRDAGAEVSIWNRTAAKAEALAAELGVDRDQRRTADSGQHRDFDLLVNATTVGLRPRTRSEARAQNARRPKGAADRCRCDHERQSWWTWSTGPRRRRSRQPPSSRGDASSTGSRSWSTREPPRCGSGPGSSRRWRRCERRLARPEEPDGDRQAPRTPAARPLDGGRGDRAPSSPDDADARPGLTPPLGRGNSAMFLTDVIVELGYATRERVDEVIAGGAAAPAARPTTLLVERKADRRRPALARGRRALRPRPRRPQRLPRRHGRREPALGPGARAATRPSRSATSTPRRCCSRWPTRRTCSRSTTSR